MQGYDLCIMVLLPWASRKRCKAGVLFILFMKPFSYIQTEGFSISKLFCPLTGVTYNINCAIVVM